MIRVCSGNSAATAGANYRERGHQTGKSLEERYKKGEASLGRATELAGVPVGTMMTILTEYGEGSRVEQEDYLQGLQGLSKVW